MFLEKGADKAQKTLDGKNICHLAAERDNVPILQYIYDHHARFRSMFNVESAAGGIPLWLAILNKHSASSSFLLEISDLDKTIADTGMNALHLAAEAGDGTVVRLVVDAFRKAGKTLEARTTDGVTPLMVAITNEKLDAFKSLLASGENPLERYPDGLIYAQSDVNLLMAVASSTPHAEFVNELLEHPSAKDLIFAMDRAGQSVLHYSVAVQQIPQSYLRLLRRWMPEMKMVSRPCTLLVIGHFITRVSMDCVQTSSALCLITTRMLRPRIVLEIDHSPTSVDRIRFQPKRKCSGLL